MKKFILLGSMLLAFITTTIGCTTKAAEKSDEQTTVTELPFNKVDITENNDNIRANTKIQVAILLDTSSSMDGLIEQTKSRLWNIVNTLTTLKYNGRIPEIEIAIYEYGNNDIHTKDYIRQVTPLTTDLDLISAKLFALTTYGGDEYCGAVINKAIRGLDWGNSKADMRLIYIAGNESFTQGDISYKTAIANALEKGIFVNTIHCGRTRDGIDGMWRDAAVRGKGKYFNIDHNVRVRHYDTPYDDRISLCNERLNTTYIGYGQAGVERMEVQKAQDMNAKSISQSNFAERAVSKSQKMYNNSNWDLVDKVKDNANALDDIKQEELPKQLQDKSKAELKGLIAQKETERAAIQKEINELAKKRQAYIEDQSKNEGSGDDLGKAINESILAFANQNGYTVSK